jgi:hypothetical protein
MRALTGVTEALTAKHFDPVLQEGLHEHTWSVTAFYAATPFRDARALKVGLRDFLDHLPGPDGLLPPDLWSGEALAAAVLVLEGTVGARVSRPEGFIAEAWR